MVTKAALFWLCTTSLASFVLCSRNSSRLLRRDDVIDKNFEKCRGDTEWENNILARFTGIFFGDFITINSQDILGSLAVQGTFSAPNYVVNANNGANCTDLNSLSSYALVVGGTVNTYNTQIHGSAFINGGGNIEQIKQLNQGCIVTDKLGTGLFDFNLVEKMLVGTSEDFATYPPTIILSNDGTIKELRENQLDYYEIITFHSCEQAICSYYTDLESQIDSIFLGSGNWNGIKSTVNPDKTYVFNIPVKNGNTIIIDTNSPSLGFNPCKVVLNFYPVDEQGFFLPLSEITVLRKTGSQLGGLTLAPRAHIIDGSTGNFAGNLVGLSYLWENANAGTEIHNYKAAGGTCDMYHGCLPVHVVVPPPPMDAAMLSVSMPSISVSSATASTSVVSYTSISIPSVAMLTSTYSPCPTALETTQTTTDTETNTITIVEPTKTMLVLLGTVTEVIDTVTEPGTTLTQPAITVTQLAGTLTQFVGTVTVASGSTTLTEVQVETETSTSTALLIEEHTTTQLETVTTTAIQIEDTTTTTIQTERVTTTTTAPNSIETTTTTQAGLLDTVTIVLIKPTTKISPIVTLISTDTQVLTASVCTETNAIFTTRTTTIGYYGATSSGACTTKSKHYHKGSDKECYEDDEDNNEDD